MQFKYIFGAALATVAVTAQDATVNLTSLLASNSNLTALTTLLDAYPDVAGALANATNITIFAPSNSAFEAANSSGALTALTQVDGAVPSLLQYHVVVGTILAENITETPAFAPTLLNDTAYANVTGGQVVEAQLVDGGVSIFSGLKANVSVIEPNLIFNGGVVHVIDGLLSIPPAVGTVLTESGLTALLGAVQATNLTTTLSETADLTVFAPLNSAFQDIASALANLTVEQAASILSYHVIAGTVAYSSTLTNGSVPSLAGGNLTITIEQGEVFVNSARVVNADILLANGVLHVIDSVLNPNDTATANATQSEPYNAYNATSGTEVPYTSGVPAATSTNAALTSTADAVASGYTTPAGGAIGSNAAGNPEASSTSAAGAAVMTAGIGAAALFGGAAMLVGW